MKTNQTVEPKIADDFKSVSFAVNDGQPDIVLDMTKLHPAVVERAACVGMAQVRIVDAAAIPMTRKDGSIIPADERTALKRAKMQALVDHYMTGTSLWSRVTEAGPQGGFLFEALCKVYGHMKAPTEIRAWLDGLSEKEQSALRDDDTIAPVIAELKKAKSAGKPAVDTKSLLAALKPADDAPAAADQTPPASSVDAQP